MYKYLLSPYSSTPCTVYILCMQTYIQTQPTMYTLTQARLCRYIAKAKGTNQNADYKFWPLVR